MSKSVLGSGSDVAGYFLFTMGGKFVHLGCVRLSPPRIVDSTGFHWITLKDDEAN